MAGNDYIIATQINLNKQPIANSDLSLYMAYLSRGVYLDDNDNIKGMEIYKTKFKYSLSQEAESEGESSEDDLQGSTFNRHRPRSRSPSNSRSSSRSSDASSMSFASGSSRSSLGRFQPLNIKEQNIEFQQNLRKFLNKARQNSNADKINGKKK